MSSLEKFNIDFSHLSFDLPNPVIDMKNDRHQINKTHQEPKRPSMTPRSKSRNKQCMPSDDEEDDEEEENEDQDSDDEISPSRGVSRLAIATPSIAKPVRKSRPLPSDDEDSEDEEQGEQETSLAGENKLHPNGNYAYQDYASYMQYETSYLHQNNQDDDDDDDDDKALVTNPNAGPVLTLVEGSHLQQLHQKQQHHQAQLAQFQYQQQQQQLQQHYYHQQQQHKSRGNISMSGMDLLKQLEQEKADSKRVKPKLDTSKVKIEGLLGRLPEPGSHNISFQQIQQQKQSRKKSQYLDPFTMEKSRSPSPSKNHYHQHRISSNNINK